MSAYVYDISVVIPAHGEGRLAHHTMNSAFRAAEYAERHGIRTEIIVILDKPDSKTADYFSTYQKSEIRLERVDFGDLGFTRNYGVSRAAGRYIAFLDADNLFGQNWLYDAYAYIGTKDKDIIIHPEYIVTFEAENMIWRQIDCDHPEFRMGNLIENNYWDATCLARKEILLKFPYEATTSTRGFGYEDWHFNCETLAAGIGHYVVPETVLFLRKKKSGSLLAFTNQTHRVIHPSKLFDPSLFISLIK